MRYRFAAKSPNLRRTRHMIQTLDTLDQLIAFPTVSRDSNLDIIGYITRFLTDRGFAVHTLPDETGQKAGIFASLGPPGAGVLLSAHTDVVPVDGQVWTRDPFRLTKEGDRLYGRGTTDMKGYLASMLVLADRAASAPLKEPLKLAISYDEEVGCIGISRMIGHLERTIGLPRACFVGEPTEMQVAIGHKGKTALRAVCHGKAGHSALAPHFLNALHLAADFIGELRALQADLAENGARDPAYSVPYSTVHVGKLVGGVALNIVPDMAEVTLEFRNIGADRTANLLERIHACAAQVKSRYQTSFPDALIEVAPFNSYPGLDTDEAAPVVALAQRLAQTNCTTKVPFGTEAGYFDALGIPTVVCGPGSMQGQGHQADEFIALSQLAQCDAMMDRLLADLCG